MIPGEMDRQELGEELKAPWVNEYISKYQAAANHFKDSAERIKRVMEGHGIKLRDKERQGEHGDCHSKEARQTYYAASSEMGG